EFAGDSPVEEGVTSEPVSASRFPANREKYRELPRFLPEQALDYLGRASVFNGLPKQFPKPVNREDPARYQGIERRLGPVIREKGKGRSLQRAPIGSARLSGPRTRLALPQRSNGHGSRGQGQGFSCRTMMGGQNTRGRRYCSFAVNQSRNSSRAS